MFGMSQSHSKCRLEMRNRRSEVRTLRLVIKDGSVSAFIDSIRSESLLMTSQSDHLIAT